MSSNPDILFLHVPKFSNYYKPLDEFMNITYIPMGVFALADMLTRERVGVQILHAGLEWILNKDFSIIEHIRNRDKIKIVFMPLFWHYQSYDVISVSEKIKKEFPHIYIFFGGFTSSYFADQIVENFPFVDGVVKGYAEEPVRALCGKIVKNAPADIDVENIVLSKSSRLFALKGAAGKKDRNYYMTSDETFNSLRFSNLALLNNFKHYIKLFSFPLAYSKNMSRSENMRLTNMGLTMFPIEVGRGCPTACSWCAGSKQNQIRMNFEAVIMWRNPEKVADTIEEAMLFGYKTFAVCFDSEPVKQQYYLDLFGVIRKRGLKCGFYFECYALPTPEFIESFKNTFELDKSVIAISPECGNEAVRRKNKGFYFSNAEFYKTLDILSKNHIKTDVFFTMGIPHETIETLYDTKKMIDAISASYKNIGRMMTWGIQMEPGSPMFE
ncbi:MAG TPA: radical SAM protein, partial [Candidatus Wallbacteria bacterium]|nr:radical SAM protein [Candidatus Wallbacteria bacterium]